jgi:hypothetical protein
MCLAEYAGSTEAPSQLRAEDTSPGRCHRLDRCRIGAGPLVHDGRVYIGISGVGAGPHPDQGLSVVGVSGRTASRGRWRLSMRRSARR